MSNQLKSLGLHLPISMLRFPTADGKASTYHARFHAVEAAGRAERDAKTALAGAIAWATQEISEPYVHQHGRDTPVTLAFAKASAAKVQVRDGSLELVLPGDAASYDLDVRAAGGELRVPERLQKTTEGTDSVVKKSGGANAQPIFVRGVGTTITIR